MRGVFKWTITPCSSSIILVVIKGLVLWHLGSSLCILFCSFCSQLSVWEHQCAGWTRAQTLRKGGPSFILDPQSSTQHFVCWRGPAHTWLHNLDPPTSGLRICCLAGSPDTSVVPRLPAALQPWPHSWLLLCWLSPPCVPQPLLSPTAQSWSSLWSWTATVLWVSAYQYSFWAWAAVFWC